MSETGGLFTVLSGFLFVLSFNFIYEEWRSAALKSTVEQFDSISPDKKYTNEKIRELKQRISFEGLFILHDKVKQYTDFNDKELI